MIVRSWCAIVALAVGMSSANLHSQTGAPAAGIRVTLLGTANLVEACRGVDLLIHEAIDEDVVRRIAANDQRLVQAIVGHHTTPEQAADIFRRTGPRLAVFSHAPPVSAILERTRRSYNGRVEYGEDLIVIDVGDEVVVQRPPAAPARNP